MKVTSDDSGSWLYLSIIDPGNCTRSKHKQDFQVTQVLKVKLIVQAGNIKKGHIFKLYYSHFKYNTSLYWSSSKSYGRNRQKSLDALNSDS